MLDLCQMTMITTVVYLKIPKYKMPITTTTTALLETLIIVLVEVHVCMIRRRWDYNYFRTK